MTQLSQMSHSSFETHPELSEQVTKICEEKDISLPSSDEIKLRLRRKTRLDNYHFLYGNIRHIKTLLTFLKVLFNLLTLDVNKMCYLENNLPILKSINSR